jgi:hypothetical protein
MKEYVCPALPLSTIVYLVQIQQALYCVLHVKLEHFFHPHKILVFFALSTVMFAYPLQLVLYAVLDTQKILLEFVSVLQHAAHSLMQILLVSVAIYRWISWQILLLYYV